VTKASVTLGGGPAAGYALAGDARLDSAMTKHDRQILWRAYEGLSPHHKTALHLTALIGDQVPRGTFVQALAATRSRTPDGKAWSGRSVHELFEDLRALGVLERDLTCAAAVRHQIAVDAAEGDQGALLIRALIRTLPRSDRERPNIFPYLYHRHALAEDRDLLRRVRLAVYANDDAEFVRLRELFDRDDEEQAGKTLLALFLAKLPADMEWLERRSSMEWSSRFLKRAQRTPLSPSRDSYSQTTRPRPR
jgi:hypothetical protein